MQVLEFDGEPIGGAEQGAFGEVAEDLVVHLLDGLGDALSHFADDAVHAIGNTVHGRHVLLLNNLLVRIKNPDILEEKVIITQKTIWK